MKTVFRLMGLAAALYLMPGARAADLSGTWKGAFEFQGTSVPTTLNLRSGETGITGTIEGLPTSPTELHDGKMEGDVVTFWVNTDYQGQTYKLVYRGKVAENQIDFSFGTDDGNWGTTLTVKREDVGGTAPAAPALPDISGAWKGSWDFNGSPMNVTFNLKSAGGSVTGTVEGMGPAPIEIHDGKIDGDSVTFWINTEYQGQTYALQYKGKLANGQIDFDFGTADGAWGSNVSVKKP